MKIARRNFLRLAAAGVASPAIIGTGWAQQPYPNKRVALVVPFPVGGGVDTIARVVADKFGTAFKQTVVVDNRAGAGGITGTRAVKNAAPDGYTLLLGHSGTIAINPSLNTNSGYDPRKDFAPVGMIAAMPLALVAHPSFPAKTVADVIEIAKQQPGKLNFGTSAIGTGGYLTAEYFKSAAGLDFKIVPYNGTGPLMTDLIGGHIPVSFGVLPPAMSSLQAGQLRAIAVTGTKRFSQLPDVPTATESGLPGFDSVLYYGVLAPAGTPKPIIDQLNKELQAMAATDAVKERILAEGGDPMPSSPEEYAKNIDQDETKWSTLIKKLGLKIE
jgi:tripartite-type tricarboxylate transporter receptor subunit TctC